jgi:hypothetical protein
VVLQRLQAPSATRFASFSPFCFWSKLTCSFFGQSQGAVVKFESDPVLSYATLTHFCHRFTLLVPSRYIRGTSTFAQVFNPSWIVPSAGTGQRQGLLIRTQNCLWPRFSGGAFLGWSVSGGANHSRLFADNRFWRRVQLPRRQPVLQVQWHRRCGLGADLCRAAQLRRRPKHDADLCVSHPARPE